MKIFLVLSIFLCLTHAVKIFTKNDVEFKDIDKFINKLNTTWKAHHNFDPNHYNEDDLKVLCGTKRLNFDLPYKKIKHEKQEKIPDSFDARKVWPNCPSIRKIYDQGSCESCWALSAAEVMSDRYCIDSAGAMQVDVSFEDILSCCKFCGKGCKGGYTQRAWSYWIKYGVVSGGGYGDKKYCQPYQIPPCAHGRVKGSKRQRCSKHKHTPKCKKRCQGNVKMSYFSNRLYGSTAYKIEPKVTQIQLEIMQNGPVQAEYLVYSDFMQYRSGVYKHHRGRFLGVHAVKIIGWGTENGIPYWLAANSWNTDWGNNGFFKILRGQNECDIESSTLAGKPKMPIYFSSHKATKELLI